MKTTLAYVAATIAGVAIVLWGCRETPSASVSPRLDEGDRTPAADLGASSTPAAATAQQGSQQAHLRRLPGMDCLVNQFGIRVKVLVAKRGVCCIDRVPGGAPTGLPLRFFGIYFVFAVSPEQGDIEYFQIGTTPRTDSIVGWVPASQVARWDTRVGARYRRIAEGRTPPLLVYRDKEALAELVKTGTTNAKPVARAAFNDEHTWMPWPIAETDQFTCDGKVHELVRLHFLGEFKEGADLGTPEEASTPSKQAYTPEELTRIKKGINKLEVVFCVDNTQSTQPFIEGIRAAVEQISRGLQSLSFKPDLRLGLLLYRDYVRSIMFHEGGQLSVTKSYPLHDDVEAFLRIVRPIREASASSEDWPEAVYDGVHAAVEGTRWSEDGLSHRVVILIGDNSAHEPGSPKNPRRITSEYLIWAAQQRKARIFSLCIHGGGGEGEQRVHWSQFDALARGTGGKCYPLGEAGKVVEQIGQIMESETAVVHTRSVVLEALTKAKAAGDRGTVATQVAAQTEVNVREVTEVMEFLEGAGVDIERLGPGVPSFATGWCLTQVQGVPILQKEVYVARAEVDMLLSELNALCVHLSPDLPRLGFSVGVGGRVNPTSFFATRRPEPMDIFLMAKGIPCSQGLLKLTRSDIEHMPEEQRAILRDKMARQIVPALTNARNDDRYFRFVDDLEFGWVPESNLP